MKISKLIIIPILAVIGLFGCSPKNNETETKKSTSTTSNVSAETIKNPEAGDAAVSIEKQKIEFHYTSAEGSLSHLKGYRRYIYFDDEGNYEVRTRSGILESEGVYMYKKISPDKATLSMTWLPKRATEKASLELDMIYKNSKEGRFEGTITEGNQTALLKGRFKLKA